MSFRIQAFGGMTTGSMSVVDGRELSISLKREIWFDRDIDGHWLVWVNGPKQEHADHLFEDEETVTGAIVVRDPGVISFIAHLADLIAEPSRFEHEPTFAEGLLHNERWPGAGADPSMNGLGGPGPNGSTATPRSPKRPG